MEVAIEGLVAGLLASLACGLGALPLLAGGLDLDRRIGLAYAFAGGLMFSASVYNLLMPAFTLGADNTTRLVPMLETLGGLFAGCGSLWWLNRTLTPERLARTGWGRRLGGRVSALVFISMAFHSIPEGVAVGTGFGAESHAGSPGLGLYIAVAIAVHNMPEGLAVALPMRSEGASIGKCFLFAFLTSLPQPLAAVPAGLMVEVFRPLLLPFLGFAAGAMMYLVVVELIPDALQTRSPTQTAWAFMAGFGLMALVQVAL